MKDVIMRKVCVCWHIRRKNEDESQEERVRRPPLQKCSRNAYAHNATELPGFEVVLNYARVDVPSDKF